jgi:hypothetical protein
MGLPPGIFRNDTQPLGYAVNLDAGTATILMGHQPGRTFTLDRDAGGGFSHVKPNSTDRVHFTVIDSNTILVAGTGAAQGLTLRRWSE